MMNSLLPPELLNRFFKNKRVTISLFLVSILLIAPFLIHAFFVPIEFNQFMIQRNHLQYGVISLEELGDMLLSEYSSGWNVLLGKGIPTPPAFDDEKGMFEYIFSWIPPYAVGYPTERFYYYNASLPDVGRISGNMRLADLAKGEMSMAYFTVPEKDTHINNLSSSDGIVFTPINEYAYEVTYKGKTVHFKIPMTDKTFPQKLELLPSEQFVGQIHDESDTRLFLLFNHDTNSFYEILNEEVGLTDALEPFADDFLLGTRTGFVYYVDQPSQRKLLVGVNLNEAMENSFFDGPGDQVPIHVPMRDLLHIAYPQTLLGDGVDESGVYLHTDEWVRIAVTPFLKYADLNELPERLDSCAPMADSKSLFWTCLTKEWWNTPEWRAEKYQELLDEGKDLRAYNTQQTAYWIK